MNDPSHAASQTELAQLRTRVTELEQALAMSQENEVRLQFIVEGSNDGAWDWNMVTNKAFLSPRWFEMFGYAPNELPNNADTWFGSLHPDEAAWVAQCLQDYVAGRTDVFEIENRMRHKSGAWVWTLGRGKISMRDTAGQPVRMTGTVRDISASKQVEENLRQSQHLLQSVIDHSPAVIYVRDRAFRYLLVNRNHALLLQRDPSQVIGKCDEELFAPEVIQLFRQTDNEVLNEGKTITTEEVVMQDDMRHTFVSVKFPLYDDHGLLYAIGGISTDVTESRRAVEERAALQEQIIDVQSAALRKLSTPLIPIADGVVIMPLIGSIDESRAQLVLEHLLHGVASNHARSVILDITGVEVVDTHVASALMQAAKAVRLLGAQVIVTGIRPEIAQTIIGMGQDLHGLITRSTLQAGIAYALKR